jgi:hypothetical protein
MDQELFNNTNIQNIFNTTSKSALDEGGFCYSNRFENFNDFLDELDEIKSMLGLHAIPYVKNRNFCDEILYKKIVGISASLHTSKMIEDPSPNSFSKIISILTLDGWIFGVKTKKHTQIIVLVKPQKITDENKSPFISELFVSITKHRAKPDFNHYEDITHRFFKDEKPEFFEQWGTPLWLQANITPKELHLLR